MAGQDVHDVIKTEVRPVKTILLHNTKNQAAKYVPFAQPLALRAFIVIQRQTGGSVSADDIIVGCARDYFHRFGRLGQWYRR